MSVKLQRFEVLRGYPYTVCLSLWQRVHPPAVQISVKRGGANLHETTLVSWRGWIERLQKDYSDYFCMFLVWPWKSWFPLCYVETNVMSLCYIISKASKSRPWMSLWVITILINPLLTWTGEQLQLSSGTASLPLHGVAWSRRPWEHPVPDPVCQDSPGLCGPIAQHRSHRRSLQVDAWGCPQGEIWLAVS